MLSNIICAGVGGQGVLTLGMLLAETAAANGKYVTWVPEYGATMRGGAANTKVKISDEPIISPFMEDIDILVALDSAPLKELGNSVEEGGYILVESSLVQEIPDIPERRIIKVPAVEIAEKLGNPKGMSVAVVGAIVACTNLFPLEAATAAIEDYFEHKGLPVEKNRAVFVEGYNFMKTNI